MIDFDKLYKKMFDFVKLDFIKTSLTNFKTDIWNFNSVHFELYLSVYREMWFYTYIFFL